jgi:hypothetical protein
VSFALLTSEVDKHPRRQHWARSGCGFLSDQYGSSGKILPTRRSYGMLRELAGICDRLSRSTHPQLVIGPGLRRVAGQPGGAGVNDTKVRQIDDNSILPKSNNPSIGIKATRAMKLLPECKKWRTLQKNGA